MQKLVGKLRRAITDYKMISDGDSIAVGLSGGKDSLVLLAALAEYKKYSPERFDLCAIHVNMGFADTDKAQLAALAQYVESLGVRYTELSTDIAEIVFEARKEKNPCSLCSKMRRGALNNELKAEGANKLALGHHADDVVETMMLSLLYEGRFSTFSPVSYLDRSDVTVIRPLIYVDECDIRSLAKRLNLPVLTNPCPADKHTQREYVKTLLSDVCKDVPIARDRMKSAIFHPERNNLWKKP